MDGVPEDDGERTHPLVGSAKNDVSGIESLLAEGLDINARDHRGFSPLMLAAYAGHVEAFDSLLAHGADPSSVDHAGNSILMGVAFKGQVDFVKKLLAAGAVQSATNAAGLDARGFAALFGRTGVIEIFDEADGNGKGES